MSRRSEWLAGVHNGLPIAFGYFAVSFAFGIQARGIGLTAFQATLMSLTNLTSAGQFAALAVIAAGSSYGELALTQLVLNLRYCLMSAALSQKLARSAKPRHRFGIAYAVTDEIFGVSVLREGELSPYFSYGLMSSAIPGWTLGTLCGVISGNLLPASVISALGVAIYGMFVAIVVPQAQQDKTVCGVALVAVAASCVFHYAPLLRQISSGFQIIIITLAVAGLAAWLFPVREVQHDPA